MTVLGVIKGPKTGLIHKRHAVVEDLTGPASDVTVTAGGTATISFSVASETPRDLQYAGVESISGLPADAKIESISFDKTNKTLTLTIYNAGAADITITANSLTVRVVSIS